MMSASLFCLHNLKNNYAEFKSNFLKFLVFSHRDDSFQWMFSLADALAAGFGTFDYDTARAATSKISREAVEALEKSS